MRILLALLLLLPAVVQAAELKLATWNLEWLTARPAGDPALPADVRPKQPEDVARLRGYAETLAADVVAFQEVDGPEMAARIFPPDRYVIHVTGDRVVQRTGFAVRKGIAFAANPDLAGLDLYPQARNRLRSGADVTLQLPGGMLRLLAVHLKTGCREDRLTASDRPACATLRAQLAPLQGWIAQRRAEGVPFVLMGDFNRWMDGRDAFWAALNQPAPLARATAGKSSPCWGGGGFIDHIIAGGAARGWMQADSLRVLVFRETGIEWKRRLTDHCPVSVRFHLPD
ncbi:endonuclease/exonuclease/phosphatase family protein [Limobrevibacterium gyesilva]|uniref:Endonuclease/exonuclease/phosphatase family protein n=1 Tax=Limobrevibacterium gyesilva TaxID=2991712 RepID=A0AA41YL77_9PROT|nr:endonuclease/exonuclease/phosphatase family protein [Limobrevibacterium gyesilva]MCW3474446.1 endonuclease/exonuclease/phosphatase family protein [Limobrevibacterium gyesilva]